MILVVLTLEGAAACLTHDEGIYPTRKVNGGFPSSSPRESAGRSQGARWPNLEYALSSITRHRGA